MDVSKILFEVRHPNGKITPVEMSTAWHNKFVADIPTPQKPADWNEEDDWDVEEESQMGRAILAAYAEQAYLFNKGESNLFGTRYKGPKYKKANPKPFAEAVRKWKTEEDMNQFLNIEGRNAAGYKMLILIDDYGLDTDPIEGWVPGELED